MMRMRTAETPGMAGGRPPLLFQSLMLGGPGRDPRPRGATAGVSFALHSVLLSAAIVFPPLLSRALPSARTGQTIFLPPLEIAAPLPPPPAPLGDGLRRVGAVRRIDLRVQGFVAPVAIPTEIQPEETLIIEGCGRNCVVGGVPKDGVGLVGLDPPPPTPPAVDGPRQPVRVGGKIAPPRPLRRVAPVYPELAIAAHLAANVTLEAEVDTGGHVKSVKVLRGHPLFDEAAIEAVRQWRYQPLLLNGEPMGFILTVTVQFGLQPR